MRNIAELEAGIADALLAVARLKESNLLPPALEPLALLAPTAELATQVTIVRALDRTPLPGEEAATSFTRANGGILVTFAPHMDAADLAQRIGLQPVEERIADLVRVLDQAEQNPQFQFVALKLLRDRLLPATKAIWTAAPNVRQALITDCILNGMLHTTKVQNPRDPEHPVTAVRLNREHPDVQRLLARAR